MTAHADAPIAVDEPEPAAPAAVPRFFGKYSKLIVLGGLGCVAALLVAASAPAGIGMMAASAGIGIVVVSVGLRYPVWALLFMLFAIFLRLALPKVGTDPFLLAFCGLIVSTAIWLLGNPRERPRLGLVELAMVVYVAWNIYSIATPHELPVLIFPEFGGTFSLPRYLLIGTVLPFVTYIICRAIFSTVSSVRLLMYFVVFVGAYSAAVSIMQFTGPTSLIFPRYIVEAPNWVGRANGVLNQPGANGIVLIAGFVAAIALSTLTDQRWKRYVLWFISAASTYAIYLTHTRAIYVAFLMVLVMGAAMAKGYRRPYVTTIVLIVIGVAMNWSTFTSSDRDKGGVGSTNEVYDRLNADATAVWAFLEKPWEGWGLGRFVAINLYHHQKYSEDTPWIRGVGVSSHENELGILSELGIIGLVLWLAVLFLIFQRLIRGLRTLPEAGLTGRPLALVAFACISSLVLLGFFADLRLLDYPNTMVMALAGAAVGALDRENRAKEKPFVRLPKLRF
ncbi:O-antigen ligase [Antrihabitans sp. YC2-6]|uniref:O-antigen ligase family protein n=1 Tax=Antrihabitans sp. YC2-6 TaxID=2799498 RepID=UPI0018F64C4E|nr:O-antigen ligase family protein [Antrihabitans sp. YC2-6]MBJ8343999.1 O-antigen ligase family protein [Antrihabitans sp. YC2-6]